MTAADGQRALLRSIFAAGVAAVRAAHYLPPLLPLTPPAGRNVLIAVGKAAGDMAAVAARHQHFDAGLVVAPPGGIPPHAGLPPHFEVLVAAHPIPDARSVTAGTRALALAAGLGSGDRLLALISGGGSALLAAPLPPLTLADKMAITERLLRAGAPIADINRIRRQLSLVKGGGLAAAAAPADVVTLVLSDIPGDDVALVASGPTAAAAAAHGWRDVARRWGVAIPPELPDRHVASANPAALTCAANADTALSAMARAATAAGYSCINLGSAIEGDAAALARTHAAQANRLAGLGKSVALISGGETSVAVSGGGRGGRNQTYAATLALALAGHPAICGFAADSDGIDGNSDAAGAMVFPDTLARLKAATQHFAALLATSDTARGFAALGDAIVTGPTFTNVNDLRCILIH